MTKAEMEQMAGKLIDGLLPEVKKMLLSGASIQQVESALVNAGLPANLGRGIIRLAAVQFAVAGGNTEAAKAYVASLL